MEVPHEHRDFIEKCHIKYKIKQRYSWSFYIKTKFRKTIRYVFGYKHILTEEEMGLLN